MLTSHYMQDIQELCHRVLIIDHGKIFFDGPLSQIIDRFSQHKIISLTFEKEMARDFSAFGEVIEQTPVSVQLKVPRTKSPKHAGNFWRLVRSATSTCRNCRWKK